MFRRDLIFLCLILLVAPLAVPSSAQQPAAPASKTPSDNMNTGIIYGKNHAYSLSAPPGWVLDNKSGVNQGLFAVFYPKGLSWAKSSVVMYTNTSSKEEKGQETLRQIIDTDVANYRDNRHTKKILDGPPLLTRDRLKNAIVKYFLGDSEGNYEACAYINETKIVVFVVMTARSQKKFDENLPAFQRLVGSYLPVVGGFQLINDHKVKEEDSAEYSIPPDVMAKAEKDSKTPEGNKYDGVMFPGDPSQIIDPECMRGNQALGWVTIVLEIQKDGTPSHVYAEKHAKVYDCLVPKLAAGKYAPPPRAPFYELFKLKITK